MRNHIITLTDDEAELLYGMLTQRVYLRTDDPERDTAVAVRERVYPFTRAYAEMHEGADELGIELPPTPPLRGPSERARVLRGIGPAGSAERVADDFLLPDASEPGVRNVHGRRLYSAAWL